MDKSWGNTIVLSWSVPENRPHSSIFQNYLLAFDHLSVTEKDKPHANPCIWNKQRQNGEMCKSESVMVSVYNEG